MVEGSSHSTGNLRGISAQDEGRQDIGWTRKLLYGLAGSSVVAIIAAWSGGESSLDFLPWVFILLGIALLGLLASWLSSRVRRKQLNVALAMLLFLAAGAALVVFLFVTCAAIFVSYL